MMRHETHNFDALSFFELCPLLFLKGEAGINVFNVVMNHFANWRQVISFEKLEKYNFKRKTKNDYCLLLSQEIYLQ